LLHLFAAEAMIAIPVTTRVNNTRFDNPACLEPVPTAGEEDDSPSFRSESKIAQLTARRLSPNKNQ